MSIELDIEYHEKRLSYLPYKYRLNRRSLEVVRLLKEHWKSSLDLVLDIGTADGLMLSRIRKQIQIRRLVGIDLSLPLLRTSTTRGLCLLQANALHLPFGDNVFDAVIATALMEHMPDGNQALTEFCRILREGGICIVTTPDPLFDRIAVFLGLEKKEEHINRHHLDGLRDMMGRNGFVVVEADKFMMSPIGFPFELRIEKVMKHLKINFFLLNQLIVGRKKVRR